MVETFDCHECGATQEVELGDFGYYRRDGEVVLVEINMHGSVELARGDTLAEAFRAAANEIEY